MNAPHQNELEVSLFGHGLGECVVLHVGNGAWIIVDSCQNRNTRRPIAAEYLESIGVDASQAVELQVVTHWHDDHVRGAAELNRLCKNAQFWCSDALQPSEFFLLTQQSREWKRPQMSSGVDELREIFEGMRENRDQLRFGSANQLLMRRFDGDKPIEVWALSPSSASKLRALQQIRNQLGVEEEQPKRAVSISPNQASMALWVRVGERQILLGADLEDTGRETEGWEAVVASKERPPGRAVVYKVAHHGSANGDNERVWNELLEPNPVAALTPMRKGQNDLPRDSVVARILERTVSAYCTTGRFVKRIPRRGAVGRTIENVARRLDAIEGEPGQVRIRFDRDSETEPMVECFRGACRLPWEGQSPGG